jgi:hypothetical protein
LGYAPDAHHYPQKSTNPAALTADQRWRRQARVGHQAELKT